MSIYDTDRDILHLLDTNKKQTKQELIEYSRLNDATVSRSLKRLRERKLIIFHPNLMDMRKLYYTKIKGASI